MRRRKRRKQRKIIIISFISLLFIMTAGYAAFQTNINITAKGNIIEKSQVIQSWTNTSNEDFHTDYYKENIVSATFLDTNTVSDNATESWDVSEKRDKGVMAWVVPNGEDNTKYDLYIGANKGVIANEDSSHLFFSFSGIKTIEFGKNFDTSNVITMFRMFQFCYNLEEADVNNFNTTKVTNMWVMFDKCYNLQTVDVSNWDTSNVTNMIAMFSNCQSLTQLNLCSFDTRKVTDMRWIFGSTKNIDKVYVGPNWITTNANTEGMWEVSKISSVTTGQC